ncbi:hypothetical protein KI387_040143, partial [Taxus chinensis]
LSGGVGRRGVDMDGVGKRGADDDEALCDVDGRLSSETYEVVDDDGDGDCDGTIL